jgi:hypothetical protein
VELERRLGSKMADEEWKCLLSGGVLVLGCISILVVFVFFDQMLAYTHVFRGRNNKALQFSRPPLWRRVFTFSIRAKDSSTCALGKQGLPFMPSHIKTIPLGRGIPPKPYKYQPLHHQSQDQAIS